LRFRNDLADLHEVILLSQRNGRLGEERQSEAEKNMVALIRYQDSRTLKKTLTLLDKSISQTVLDMILKKVPYELNFINRSLDVIKKHNYLTHKNILTALALRFSVITHQLFYLVLSS